MERHMVQLACLRRGFELPSRMRRLDYVDNVVYQLRYRHGSVSLRYFYFFYHPLYPQLLLALSSLLQHRPQYGGLSQYAQPNEEPW
jgi:hypothetical protein